MHASIWKITGETEDLLRRYDCMVADIPIENMRMHLCLPLPDGILVVDTCPSKEVFDAFSQSEGVPSPASEAWPAHSRTIGRLPGARSLHERRAGGVMRRRSCSRTSGRTSTSGSRTYSLACK